MSLRPFVHLDVGLRGCAAGRIVALPGADAHRLGTVLRLEAGDRLEVADGQGTLAPAVLEPGGGSLRLTSAATWRPPPTPQLCLGQALPKGRKLDDVLRWATELGVDRVRPLAARRSVARLDDARRQRATRRWESVIRSASEQARRARRPVLEPLLALNEVVAQADGPVLLTVPGAPSLPEVLAEVTARPPGLGRAGDRSRGQPPSGPVAIHLLVGPEGGWEAREVEMALAAGAHAVGLGPTVLRTEHAGPAALAVAAACLGRWTSADDRA